MRTTLYTMKEMNISKRRDLISKDQKSDSQRFALLPFTKLNSDMEVTITSSSLWRTK